MAQENCFAYKNGKCAALNEVDCKWCSFFKTAARLRQEIEKSRERRKGLSKEQQAYIQIKYDMREDEPWG